MLYHTACSCTASQRPAVYDTQKKQQGALTTWCWLSSALAAADIVRDPYHLQRLCTSQLAPELAQAQLSRLTFGE